MRAIPGSDDGASRIRDSAEVLGEMRRRGPVREGVGVRQIYGIVIANTAVF